MSISGAADLTEGGQLSYTLTRTWALGEDQGQLIVNVQLAETGDYITWPTDHQPDANGMVTIPVTIAKGSLTTTITLDTVDDSVSENAGSVTATIVADTNRQLCGGHEQRSHHQIVHDPPTISVEAVAGEITEGANAQYRITRLGNTSGSLRVGLYVTGLPKIMTDATEAIVLTSDNEDQSQRLTINGGLGRLHPGVRGRRHREDPFPHHRVRQRERGRRLCCREHSPADRRPLHRRDRPRPGPRQGRRHPHREPDPAGRPHRD